MTAEFSKKIEKLTDEMRKTGMLFTMCIGEQIDARLEAITAIRGDGFDIMDMTARIITDFCKMSGIESDDVLRKIKKRVERNLKDEKQEDDCEVDVKRIVGKIERELKRRLKAEGINADISMEVVKADADFVAGEEYGKGEKADE